MFTKTGGVLHNLGASSPVRFGDGFQYTTKAGPSEPIIGWKVRPAEYRFARWKQKDGHRPTAAPRHDLNGGHVDLIEIWTLFAIDFDVHEIAIHGVRDCGV